jgi:hypothetical protein
MIDGTFRVAVAKCAVQGVQFFLLWVATQPTEITEVAFHTVDARNNVRHTENPEGSKGELRGLGMCVGISKAFLPTILCWIDARRQPVFIVKPNFERLRASEQPILKKDAPHR